MSNYKPLKTFSALASPLFSVFAYLCAGISAILLVVCLIVPFVNVPTEDMLLPPFMTMQEQEAIYEISMGNGVLIRRAAEQVTLGDIKIAIYCGIGVAVAVLLVLIPVFYLLSKLLKNVASDTLFAMSNAVYIKRLGLAILVGNSVILFVERFFNYFLIHTFLAGEEEVVFRAGIDVMGIVMGVFVILIGNIYGYAIQLHNGGVYAAGDERGNLPVSSAETAEVSSEEHSSQYSR